MESQLQSKVDPLRRRSRWSQTEDVARLVARHKQVSGIATARNQKSEFFSVHNFNPDTTG